MKPLRILLFICALSLQFSYSRAEDVVIDGINYYYDTSRKYADVYGYEEGITDVVILDSINGCKVSFISDRVFEDCRTLTSIVIPDGVTCLRGELFSGCENLHTVILPKTLKEIWYGVFSCCYSLRSIEIPDSVISIGSRAFSNCKSLSSITIPNSVETIGERAFDWCNNLVTLSMGSNVTEIGEYAFEYCSKISSITIPHGLSSIENGTFLGCYGITQISIPEIVTRIGRYAFAGCGIESVVIPNCVKEIGECAFLGCERLKTITIPNSLTSIGTDVFAAEYSKNVRLRYINVLGNDVADYSVYTPLLSNLQNVLLVVEENLYDEYVKIPGWKKISKQIISADMLKLRTVDITADENRSALFAALGDSSKYFANLKIKGSINGYDIMALRNKTSHLLYLDLEEANIVANDGGYEYYTGYSLTEDDVLGENSFFETRLVDITLPKSLKRIDDNSFKNCQFLEMVTMSDGIESIGQDAFLNCSLLKQVDFPKSLISIGESAFANCFSLGPILTIPDKISVIEPFTFRGCSSIDTVYIGKSVVEIGQKTFYECSKISDIVFNRNLLRIGKSAFEGCSGLLSASLPYTVETIGDYAFKGCGSLKSIKIPSMAKHIGNYAFYDCDNIEDVYTYTVEPTSIDQNTFSCFAYAILHVPGASIDLYDYNTQWSQFQTVREFDEPYDAFYLNGDLYLDDNTGRLDGNPDAEMYSTSGIIVQGTDKQMLTDIILEHDGKDGATIIGAAGDATGNQVNLTAKSLNVNISVEGNRWYFFCFPFDVAADSIECTADYMFYSYDGNRRANHGEGWVKMTSDGFSLKKGSGYIFQASCTGVLTIHVGSEYLTFKAGSEQEVLNQYTSDIVSNESWNLIGNPYISYYDVQDLAAVYDAPIIVWNGDGYDAYKPGDDDDYQLKPFEAFFVQKESGKSYVEFLPENRLTYSQSLDRISLRANQRAAMGTPISPDRQLVNITIMDKDSVTDRTRIVYSTKASMDYEIGVDAAKFHSDGVPQIYTLNGTTNYAINERPMGGDDIKLGYIAPKAGVYTFSVPRQDAEIEIYDNVAQTVVDFTFGAYAFESAAGTFNDRFVVRKTGGVTAVEGGFRLDGLTVVAVDGGIDIEGQLNGKVSVYNESGILVAEPTEIGRVDLEDGTYIIKICDKSIKLNLNRGVYAL